MKQSAQRSPLLSISLLLAGSLAAAAIGAPRSADETPGVSVTVYSSADPSGFDPQRFISQQRGGFDPNSARQVPGFGVVKEIRDVEFQAGTTELRFTDVAAFIDPTTVSFTDLTGANTTVLEQNFEFDLVSPAKLLEKYVDQPVTVQLPRGNSSEEIKGTLLAASQGQLILQTSGGVRMIPQGTAVVTIDSAAGLITRPTLVWKVQSDAAGSRPVRTTYQTNGLTWRADYTLVIDADDTSADLGAWVSLLNVSGAAYSNARLKLIAGDVQRIQPQRFPAGRGGAMEMRTMAADSGGFDEKSFFEYHLYTLPRPIDLLANTTQQIMLFPTARDVPVKKILIFDPAASMARVGWSRTPYTDRNFGLSQTEKVDVYIRFVNDEPSNLGMPLPRGKVRVYTEDDADGTLEFVGEDLIDHTPRKEEVSIRVGRAFDVVGERTQTDFSVDTGRKTMTESFSIELRNRKKEPVTVVVREHLYRWTNWEITAHSDDFRKVNAQTIEFEESLPADSTRTITYSVRYTW